MPFFSASDEEQIEACERNEGAIKSSQVLLLNHIACKREDWFPILILAFNQSGLSHLSELIHEGFAQARKFCYCKYVHL